ncbi:N-acetylmuramoyl-L-alanine amidase [soil metagenome]
MKTSLLALVVVASACSATGDPALASSLPAVASSASTSMAPIPTTSAPNTTTTTPTTAPIAAPQLSGRMIVLDPGHNGMNWAHPEAINQMVDIGTGAKACNTTGTSAADGYPEAEFNWAVALLAGAELERLGATVTLTREDNEGWGPCITERAAIGNALGTDAVISIHADGGPETGRGFHVIHPKVVPGYTDDIAESSTRLAEALHAAYLKTGMPVADYIGFGGFSVRDDLGGLTLSDSPVVFLEAGNMRNGEDLELLKSAEFQQAIAEAIVAALAEFLG